jgi:hypothetical protein
MLCIDNLSNLPKVLARLIGNSSEKQNESGCCWLSEWENNFKQDCAVTG